MRMHYHLVSHFECFTTNHALSLLISLASLVLIELYKASLWSGCPGHKRVPWFSFFVFGWLDGCKWFSCVVQEALFLGGPLTDFSDVLYSKPIRSVEVKDFELSFPDQKCHGFRVFKDVGRFISWPKLDPRVPCWDQAIAAIWFLLARHGESISIQDSHVVKKIRVFYCKSRRFDKIGVLL